MGLFGAIKGAVVGGVLGPVGQVTGALVGNNRENKQNDKKAGNMAALYDQSGRPIPPEYQAAYDPNTMSLSGDVASGFQNNTALQKFKAEANRDGSSPWAAMAQQEQERLGGVEKDKARRLAASSASQARASLAAQGGLSSGARERVETNAQNDLMNLNQNISQTMLGNNAQIMMNDEQNRLGNLQTGANFGLQEQNAMNLAKQYDIGNAMQAVRDQNAFNLQDFQTRGQIWGADRNAKAVANQSSGSSFICTALREQGLMSPRESVKMTNFMLKSILTRADFFAWYFKHGKSAVDFATQSNFDFSKIKHKFVDEILSTIERKGITAAQDMYISRAMNFCNQFTFGISGIKPSLAKPGKLKSILALPAVFCRPQTWVWAKEYYGAKIGRKLSKMFAKGCSV